MTESQEQRTVVEYLEWLKVPFYHVANERKCSPQRGAALKRLGVQAGVPDLCIPVPMGGFHGLYIEMKAKSGRLSANQSRWLKTLRSYGYHADVCYGADEAIDLIGKYMREEVVTSRAE